MKNFIPIILIFSIILSMNVQSQTDIQSAYKGMYEKYGNIKSVTLKFQMREKREFKGTLKAARGNKFFLELSDRDIVCNGKTIWNHDRKQNKVIISNYESSEKGVSIEEFFFNFLKNYKPVTLSEENTSKGIKSYLLKLEPEKNGKHEVEEITLWYNPEDFMLRTVRIKVGIDVQTWDIEDLNLNCISSNNIFDFKPSDKTGVIDLR